MEKYWTKVKEFQGVQILRDPETMQCRILPIERPQPQQLVTPVYSQAAIEAAEKAVALYKMMNEAGERTKAAMQPQPERPKTPEEEWRTRPDIRAEFVSQASYEAYMRAARDGRTKLYGCKS